MMSGEEKSKAKSKVFFVVGPTASGKTDAAVECALALNGEVISADAIQIYRGLDKGSAKPTPDEMRGVPHHLIDTVDYTDSSYNVACFARDAGKCIRDIISRGRTPIVCGGTGLYVNSLVYPLDFTEVKPDKELREKLLSEEDKAPGNLYKRLLTVDPVSAERLHPNDIKRIVRALEVYELTGRSLTDNGGDFMNSRGADIPYEPVIAGLAMDRARLYDRIGRRVDMMIANGLFEEADALYKSVSFDPPLSLQAIGYKQFSAFFEGLCTFDEAVQLIKRDTRRFAKRQISWFKRDERIRWFNADDYPDRAALHADIIEYFKGEMIK
jgi:tRNA dimethylallyltransferase